MIYVYYIILFFVISEVITDVDFIVVKDVTPPGILPLVFSTVELSQVPLHPLISNLLMRDGCTMEMRIYALVNSSCTQPPPTLADPWALALFFPWMASLQGWGLLSCGIPQCGDEKRGQMPHPLSTLQHFSLIAHSNSVILSILMGNFCFS